MIIEATQKIKVLKRDLEGEIFLLIERFENQTATVVTGVSLERNPVDMEFGVDPDSPQMVLHQVQVGVMIEPVFKRNP